MTGVYLKACVLQNTKPVFWRLQVKGLSNYTKNCLCTYPKYADTPMYYKKS